MKPRPPPKPTRLRVLEGNPSRRPLNSNEPQPEPRQKPPPPPRYLGKVGKAEWRRTAKILVGLGLLTDLDLVVLAAYCASFEHWCDAEEALGREGMTYLAPNGSEKKSPWVGIARDAKADMKAFAAEFGMSPSSRSRINISPPNPVDELEEFLFGSRGSSPPGKSS